jgi:23S rRNA pseudouridine955/2504/2580 synthase
MTEVIIKTNDADQRFDRFLRKAYPKLSLSKIQKLIRTGRIKLNGKKVKNDQRLILNDKIQLYVSLEYISANPNTKDFKLSNPNINIVYEDENLLVVNKPRGVVVHIDESKTPRTLINQILHYLYLKHAYDPDAEQSFVPTLLHRIDMNTVGLVMCAKNAATARILMEKIKQHEVDKYY